MIGMTQGMITQLELGKTEIRYETAVKIADALDVSVKYLLEGDKASKDYPVNQKMVEFLEKRPELREQIYEKMGTTEEKRPAEETDQITIGERVIELMRKKNMTQKEFSNRTNIGQSTISDWKRKKINPSADKILIICDVLGVTPEELLSGSDRKKGRQQDCYVVGKDSELGEIVRAYKSLDITSKERLMGYLDALKGRPEL